MILGPAHLTYRTLGAWATAGIALWFSLGVLDVTDTASGTVRLCMMPGLLQLGGSLALAVLLGLVFELNNPWPSVVQRDAVLPLYGLAALALPYLPWLPDALPVLRVFAGPGKYLLWAIVLAQVVWAAFGSGRGRPVASTFRELPRAGAFLLIFSASALVTVGASRVLASSGLFPAGDEPHYLVVSQSLLADRDADVANNYSQRDYAGYYGRDLEPRTIPSADQTRNLTAMPLGLPLILVPAFKLAGYPGVVLFLNLLAAIVASAMWVWLRRLTGSVSAATFGWASAALSVPAVVGSGVVAPDVAASLLVILGGSCALWTTPINAEPESAPAWTIRGWRALVLGTTAGALPWLHPSYLAAAVVLLAVGAWRALRTARTSGGRTVIGGLTLAAVPVAASALAWTIHYRDVSLATWFWLPAGRIAVSPGLNLIGRHLLALFADQEFGVLSYAPALAIAALGLWSLWQQRGSRRAFAVEISLVVGALAASAAIFHASRGGAALPGELIVPGLLLLAAPLAFEYKRAGQHPERRAIYRLLLLMGLGATVAAVTVHGGRLLTLGHDGTSPLIAWLSPDWPLTSYAPDFLAQSAWTGLAQAGVWLVAIVSCASLVGWLAARADLLPATSRIGRGLAFIRADAGALLAIILATGIMPAIIGAATKEGSEQRDRSRIEMLDSFDPYARPIAVRFDPWSIVDARTVPRLFELSARPVAPASDHQDDTQFNARFALPAGRYHIQIMGRASQSDEGPLSGRLALRAGTWGGAMIEWTIEGTDTRQWTGAFELPADIGQVTFMTKGLLGRQVRELRIVPYRAVPFLDRIAAENVGAAAVFDRLLFLFHDDNIYPDATGFWVRPAAPARVSVVSRTGQLITDLRLVLSTRVANTIHIEMPDRVWKETLAADEEREIFVKPTALDGTVRLVITADQGFYPVDKEPGSSDRRHLGCYVRIIE